MSKYKHIEAHEIESNYEFNLVRRIILKTFPWIKSLYLDPNGVNSYRTIYVGVDIDPILLGETYNLPPNENIEYHVKNNIQLSTLFLEIIIRGGDEIIIPIAQQVKDIIYSLGRNPAIPEELRLPSDRYFGIDHWYVNRGGLTYSEYFEKIIQS